MGLDGISVNQLRVTPEFNSSELNSQVNFSSETGIKAVDGLSQGQRVDPDKRHEKEKNSFSNNADNSQEESDENDVKEEVIKYDLTKADKYCLKLDEKTDKILIVEKTSEKVVQTIDAQQLSQFVHFLPNSCGAIINKKY